uniref:Uncharacterized protein n=1 Tax=Wuchereria bancrofti TaxID=6293 RepID=A0AAF5PSG2_WUCBA
MASIHVTNAKSTGNLELTNNRHWEIPMNIFAHVQMQQSLLFRSYTFESLIRNFTIVSKRPILRATRNKRSRNLKRKNEVPQIPNMSSVVEMSESKVLLPCNICITPMVFCLLPELSQTQHDIANFDETPSAPANIYDGGRTIPLIDEKYKE